MEVVGEIKIDEFQDEIFRVCGKCKNKWLHAYWDEEVEEYIYLTEENEGCCCECRKKEDY